MTCDVTNPAAVSGFWGIQYLKRRAFYNEFGEYEFVFERTIVPTKKMENENE